MQTILRLGYETMSRWATSGPFLLALFLLLVIYFGSGIGHYPLFDVDEPRYAETAREMLLPPYDWVAPHFNFELRYDKPPLFYWLIAMSYQIFGITEGAARLVSVAAASLTGVMVYATARRFWSVSAAMLAVGVFMTMPQVFILSRWAVTDMTLTMMMTGAWIGLMFGWLEDRRWFLFAGLMAGLGLLTKGPVALALPGITLLLALWAWAQLGRLPDTLSKRDRWQVLGWSLLKSPWLWIGFVLALCVAMPWFMAMAQRFPEEFGSKLYLHNITRFTATVSGHQGAWWFYIPIFLIGAIPWTGFAPLLITVVLPELRHVLSGEWKTLPQHHAPEKAAWLYVLLWFVVVALFFSLSKTKLLTYVLPGFPALALLIGWTLDSWAKTVASTRWLLGTLLTVALILLVGVGVTQAMGVTHLLPKALRTMDYPGVFPVLILGVSITLAASAGVLYRTRQVQWTLATLMLGLLMVYTFSGWIVLPMLGRLIQHDLQQCATLAKQDKAILATYGTKKPSLVYYTQTQVYYVLSHKDSPADTKRVLQHLYDKRRPLYLVMKTPVRYELDGVYQMTERYRGQQFSLMQVDITPSQRMRQPLDSELPDYTHQ